MPTPSVFVIDRSAERVGVSVSIELSSPEAGSATPTGGVTVAVLTRFPVAVASVWAATATISIGAISYAASFLPILGVHPALSATGVIWAVTLINLIGTRTAGGFQLVTTILKLLPLIIVAVLIFLVLGKQGTAAITPYPAQGLSLGLVNQAAAITLWAMVGFEAACAASGRIENPARNVPRATFVGALLCGVIYLIVCSGIALMLPADQVATSNAPFELFVATFWSPGPAAFVALFAAISAVGAVNGWVLVQGEVPYEMAQRQMMPAWFGKTASNGVPARAVMIGSLLATLLVLTNSSRSMGGLFTFMALLTTSVTLWLYLACALVALKCACGMIKRRRVKPPRRKILF